MVCITLTVQIQLQQLRIKEPKHGFDYNTISFSELIINCVIMSWREIFSLQGIVK